MHEVYARTAIVAACRRLYDRNLLAAGDGNVSIRLDDGRVLITPSGCHKAFCPPEALALLAADGRPISNRASCETALHLAVYQAAPAARCVVHAHAPTAVAWTIARPDDDHLPEACLGEVVLALGRVPVVPFALPGSVAMADHVRPYLPRHRALLLARHGVLCWGEDLDEAVGGAERLEHVAQTLRDALVFGGLSELGAEAMAALRAQREALGERLL